MFARAMSPGRFLFSALCSIGFLHAQQTGVSGPIAGFTFDAPTRSIRAVIGSLGSASLGPPIIEQLEFASIAPRQNYAIAFHGGQPVLVSGLGAGKPSTRVLPVSGSCPEGVAWSNDGSAVVLYSKTQGWIQPFTGLPDSVTSTQPLSLVSLGGALSAVATGPHGQPIAIGITGNHAGVYVITGANITPLLEASGPTALVFSDDGSVLYALDQVSKQVFQSGISPSGGTNSPVQTWPLGLDDAISIQPARDASNRQVLYVAGRTDRLLVVFDGSSHQSMAQMPLSFEPTTLSPLGSNGFLLRPRSADGDPLWSVSFRPEPAVYFVPAAPVSNPLERRRGVLEQ